MYIGWLGIYSRPLARHGWPYEGRASSVTRNGKLCCYSGTRGVVRNGSHCSLLEADETVYVA
jgi:hypothetical protein